MTRAPWACQARQKQALTHSSSSRTHRGPDMTKYPLNSDWLHSCTADKTALFQGQGQEVCACVHVRVHVCACFGLTNRPELSGKWGSHFAACKIKIIADANRQHYVTYCWKVSTILLISTIIISIKLSWVFFRFRFNWVSFNMNNYKI